MRHKTHSIEKEECRERSDEEYSDALEEYRKKTMVTHYDGKLIYKPPEENIDPNSVLGQKYKLAKEICENTFAVKIDNIQQIKKNSENWEVKLKVNDESQKSESPKKKAKKDDFKSNSAARKNAQDKLS